MLCYIEYVRAPPTPTSAHPKCSTPCVVPVGFHKKSEPNSKSKVFMELVNISDAAISPTL